MKKCLALLLLCLLAAPVAVVDAAPKVNSDGTVFSSSGQKIGMIKNDGTVFNASGSKIGTVKSDGSVFNASGSKIGSVQGSNKNAAAVFFFFK